MRRGGGLTLLLILLMLLAGCPSTYVRPTGAPKADVAAAERLVREGKLRDAAQMYESLAAQATGTKQTGLYLEAAKQWSAAGAYPEAQRVLATIAPAVTVSRRPPMPCCRQSSHWPRKTHSALLRSCDDLERRPTRKPLPMRWRCRPVRSSHSGTQSRV